MTSYPRRRIRPRTVGPLSVMLPGAYRGGVEYSYSEGREISWDREIYAAVPTLEHEYFVYYLQG